MSENGIRYYETPCISSHFVEILQDKHIDLITLILLELPNVRDARFHLLNKELHANGYSLKINLRRPTRCRQILHSERTLRSNI